MYYCMYMYMCINMYVLWKRKKAPGKVPALPVKTDHSCQGDTVTASVAQTLFPLDTETLLAFSGVRLSVAVSAVANHHSSLGRGKGL